MSRPTRQITIARLARSAGVGVETVRYYQRRGLMRLPARAGEASYRSYDEQDRRRLRFIRSAQAAGFTLQEIEQLLALDRAAQRSRVQELASARLAALEAQQREIEASRAALQSLLTSCLSSPVGPCPIIEAFDCERPPHAEPLVG